MFRYENMCEVLMGKAKNKHMGKRITIVLDDDLVKKLREKQAKKIKESVESISFSRILNETLRKSIK